jgi:hypothetical protein
MARISGRLMHRINGKPLFSQVVMTQPQAGTENHHSGMPEDVDDFGIR